MQKLSSTLNNLDHMQKSLSMYKENLSRVMHLNKTWKSNRDVKFKLAFRGLQRIFIKISYRSLQCFTIYKVSKFNCFINDGAFWGFILGCFRNEINEGINILLASNQIFDLWSIFLLAWEERRILDDIDFLPSNLPLVRKFVLFSLVRLSVSQLVDFANELLV